MISLSALSALPQLFIDLKRTSFLSALLNIIVPLVVLHQVLH